VLLVRLGKIEQASQVFSQLSISERESRRGLETRLFLQYRQADDAGVVSTWRNELQADTEIDPSALSYLTHALANTGQTELAFELALNALERPNLSARQRGQLLEVCGIFEFNRSKYREAHRFLSSELEILQSSHQEHRARNALYYRALASQELGWFDQAIPDLQLALQLAALTGSLESIAYIQILLGTQLFELGLYDQAEETLLEASNLAMRIPLAQVHADLETCLSDYYREVETPTSGVLALQHAQTALKLARRLQSPVHLSEALFCVALAEAKFGSIKRALGLVEESLTFAEQHSEPRIVSNAIWAEAVSLEVLGQTQDALRQYRHALTVVQESNHSLRRQKIVLEIHRLDRDVQAAQNQLLWFEERGLRHGINLVLRAFPDLVSKNLTSQQTQSQQQNALRIEVLGSMRLFDHNQLQTSKSAKRQELLAYLLEAHLAGRTEVSALDLAEMLYPNSFEEAALTSVKKMVHLIRSGFSKAAIQTTTNGYALGSMDSDVERFLTSGDIRLWRGQYLEGIEIQNVDTTIREVVYQKLAASIGHRSRSGITNLARSRTV
jgi:tetratricopeptide (TPR) repeat protein